jgi:uncharacterized protein
VSAGLFGLLDDVALLARLAAASGRATAKAAGVVIDDTAVTPQYIHGIAAERELPVIKRIAKGSLRNKLLLILPVAMLLSQFAPLLLTPILMLGATYLCYEAAEKIWGSIHGHDPEDTPADEDAMVSGAVRTDLVLSAEIMVIALDAITDQAFVPRLIILVVVALILTVVVYGVVAIVVKMDDVGLSLTQTTSRIGQKVGRGLVAGMPKVLATLSTVGTVAMLWVGGHILLTGATRLGWHTPYGLLHHLDEQVSHAVPAVAGVLSWLVDTGVSAVAGLIVGVMAVALVQLLSLLRQSLRK